MAAQWRAFAAPHGINPADASPAMRGAADTVLAEAARDGAARQLTNNQGRRVQLVPFAGGKEGNIPLAHGLPVLPRWVRG
jgi:hypothetical protein